MAYRDRTGFLVFFHETEGILRDPSAAPTSIRRNGTTSCTAEGKRWDFRPLAHRRDV